MAALIGEWNGALRCPEVPGETHTGNGEGGDHPPVEQVCPNTLVNSFMTRRISTSLSGGLALAALVTLTVGCSSKSTPTPTTVTSTTVHPTTTVPSGPPAPLTGLPSSAESANRCAVGVKIGNTADARPQFGLDDADVVYEEVTDGGITRLLGVFQSKAPDKVGTVRSVRPSDRTIMTPLHGVLAFSGGNEIELAAVQGMAAVLLDEDTAGDKMFRDPKGKPPNNLYARVDRLYGACGTNGPPQPLSTYRTPKAPVAGEPAQGVDIGYVTPFQVSWTWDGAHGSWVRDRFGAPDVEAGGWRVRATNVVVMSIEHSPGPQAIDGTAIIEGSGPVAVFSAGHVVRGTWSRSDLAAPPTLTADDGTPIVLTPGTTWVELPDRSYAVNVHR